MKNWIVVANAARARVLEESDEVPATGRARRAAFVHVADLVHPASRQKGVELGDDRAGHVEGTGHGLGSASYLPRTDPREREHDRFAREVARVLDHGIAEGRCAGLILVAANPFGLHDFSKDQPKGTGNFVIPAGGSQSWRYGVYLYKGAREAKHVDAAWTEWTGTTK